MGWVELEVSDDGDVGIPVYLGAFFGLGLFGSFARCAHQGVDTTLGLLRRTRRYDPMRQQLTALCGPRAISWLLPLLIVPVQAATLPVGFANSPGDWSILGALAFLAGVMSYLGLLLGFLVWLLVVFPLLLLGRVVGRRLGGVRPDDNDRFALAFGLLLLSIVTFAVALVLSTPSAHGSRGERNSGRFAALFGFGEMPVDPSWLLWLARAALLAIVGSVVLVVRVSKSRA